ncbi:heptaprenyl diphosphate synthase component 1 [Allobacillus sp. GCM10007491]|uniref:Heptaprenyl diphosphate synthase component 1 n=1 Tax=Allobacillus saliphilus TaxID=2912308 RepID=A0A941HS37_9BACI|nr:heptaprenyl diphosphate synthase component 1 [Allobacillus saliphilus]MBR7553256.1 heptaprenyl diphosphate synthase component 1 [Allobacillus saliphilus]
MNSVNDYQDQLVQTFIDKYKHTYVDIDRYDAVHLKQHLHFFQEIKPVLNDRERIIFDAIIHMQVSLQIHDRVEFDFLQSNHTHHMVGSIQMNALIGDYHSSWFYKLLSGSGELSALEHFLETVKQINRTKVELLHTEDLSVIDILDKVEEIYIGLYDAYALYYQLTDYNHLRNQIIYHFVYSHKPFWIEKMIQRNGQVKDKWLERKSQFEEDSINRQ